ncbi:uncharacterized protein LOC6615172 [Drosophila sechellia]|uniref:uncharacterized protein LOC6615172 n=1 Tax=Drosophila sechellia TaxID=7238 RepID=UPI0013DDD4BD|nr:uncharacterized protein LOC6615172 [Drosophila sechellia]
MNNKIIFKKLRNRIVPYSPPAILNPRNNRVRVRNAPAPQRNNSVQVEAALGEIAPTMAEVTVDVLAEADPNMEVEVMDEPLAEVEVLAEAGPMAEAEIEVMEEADLNNNTEDDDMAEVDIDPMAEVEMMADNDPTAEAEVLARAPRLGLNFWPRLTLRWMLKLWTELTLRLWLKLKL